MVDSNSCYLARYNNLVLVHSGFSTQLLARPTTQFGGIDDVRCSVAGLYVNESQQRV